MNPSNLSLGYYVLPPLTDLYPRVMLSSYISAVPADSQNQNGPL